MTSDPRSITWQAVGAGGAVASGEPGAVAAGIRMLESGGNAADAAVGTILALGITDFGRFAMGGEVPFIIHEARTRTTTVLCGLGRSPLSADAIAWYLKNGIPKGGDMKAAAVPGVIDLCVTALTRFGTLSFAQVVQPTLELLSAGTPQWHPKLARTLSRLVDAERKASGSGTEKLAAVSERFYRGDVASELEAWYIQMGGFLRRADLAAHRTTIEEPVSAEYQGLTVCKCGPWTQGPYLLQALRLLEGFDLVAMAHNSADYVHTVVEALKLALADRDAYYGDPLFAKVPLDRLLCDQYTALRRPLIDAARACNEPRPGDPLAMQAMRPGGAFAAWAGGTTTCVVADRHGNVVAATPSCNDTGGEKGFGGEAGVPHGSRLTSLNTTPGHPNCIAPGKRPRITLTPTLILRDNAAAAAISVAGGDLQDQTTLSVLLNWRLFGMLPPQAVTAVRFGTMVHENSFDPAADRSRALVDSRGQLLHGGLGEEVCAELTRRGHAPRRHAGSVADPVMLCIDRATGRIHAAGDPAAGRHAAALP